MFNDFAHVERNGARRDKDFFANLALANDYARPLDVTKMRLIRGLCMSADAVTDAEFRLWSLLIIRIPPEAFDEGFLFTPIGKALICKHLGWSESKFARVVKSLEDKGLVLRHFSNDGHRVRDRAFDTRAGAAKLDEIEADINAREAEHARRYQSITISKPEKTGGGANHDRGHNTATEDSSHESVSRSENDVAGAEFRGFAELGELGAHAQKPKTPPPNHVAEGVAILRQLAPEISDLVSITIDDPGCPCPNSLRNLGRAVSNEIKLPDHVWRNSERRNGLLDRVAILALAVAKPDRAFRRGRVAWARWMLTQPADKLDIWASVYAELARRKKTH